MISGLSGSVRVERRTWREPTKGLGVSDALEWKISRDRKASGRGEVMERRNRWFQTGLVLPESSDLVVSLWSGSTQKMA